MVQDDFQGRGVGTELLFRMVLLAKQMNVDGPWPSDTVFLKAKAGEVSSLSKAARCSYAASDAPTGTRLTTVVSGTRAPGGPGLLYNTNKKVPGPPGVRLFFYLEGVQLKLQNTGAKW